MESNFKKRTKERKKEIEKMIEIGYSDQQIAKNLGVDKNTICYHNKKREKNRRRYGDRGVGVYKENESYYKTIDLFIRWALIYSRSQEQRVCCIGKTFSH